ncbi:rCG49578, partial [Rattus norvegicus]
MKGLGRIPRCLRLAWLSLRVGRLSVSDWSSFFVIVVFLVNVTKGAQRRISRKANRCIFNSKILQ